MKSKFILPFGILFAVALLMVSCGPHDIGPIVEGVLYIQSDDTVFVEYPRTMYDKKYYPTLKNEYYTVRLFADTALWADCELYGGWYPEKVELHVSRETNYADMRILFVEYDGWNNFFHPNSCFNYHMLDSLMDIYGVTMPVDQDYLVVPLTCGPATN